METYLLTPSKEKYDTIQWDKGASDIKVKVQLKNSIGWDKTQPIKS